MQDNLYAIGDLQGCLESLEGFSSSFRRTPASSSWATSSTAARSRLRRCASWRELSLAGRCTGVVLGNHDLHLLAVAAGTGRLHRKDTIGEILEAPTATNCSIGCAGSRF